jgi:hypothetical protein
MARGFRQPLSSAYDNGLKARNRCGLHDESQMSERLTYTVHARWDAASKTWSTDGEDIPGLVCETDTFEARSRSLSMRHPSRCATILAFRPDKPSSSCWASGRRYVPPLDRFAACRRLRVQAGGQRTPRALVASDDTAYGHGAADDPQDDNGHCDPETGGIAQTKAF